MVEKIVMFYMEKFLIGVDASTIIKLIGGVVAVSLYKNFTAFQSSGKRVFRRTQVVLQSVRLYLFKRFLSTEISEESFFGKVVAFDIYSYRSNIKALFFFPFMDSASNISVDIYIVVALTLGVSLGFLLSRLLQTNISFGDRVLSVVGIIVIGCCLIILVVFGLLVVTRYPELIGVNEPVVLMQAKEPRPPDLYPLSYKRRDAILFYAKRIFLAVSFLFILNFMGGLYGCLLSLFWKDHSDSDEID